MKTFVSLFLLTLLSLSSLACRSNRYAQTQGVNQPERFDPTTRTWVPADTMMVRPASRPPAYVETEKTTEKVQIIDSVNPVPAELPAKPEVEQLRPAIPASSTAKPEESAGGFFSRMGKAAGNTWKSVTGGS